MADYADLEIRILERDEERGYPVELTLNREQEFGGGFLESGILPWVPTASPDDDGEKLFRWLLADKALSTAWAEVRGQQPQRRIRLRIDTSAPELHTIPWELLREPGDDGVPQYLAAGTATPFSRYLAGRWQPGLPIFQRPIKVLVAIANPDNLSEYKLSAIDIEREFDLLLEATQGEEIELALLPQPCTFLALETALKEGYHALHFIGHGAYHRDEGRAALLIADESNQVKLVKDWELAEMLRRQLGDPAFRQDDMLRLVFLASCQTASRCPHDAFRGLAPQLVAAGVPAVLAMQGQVAIDTARLFTTTFYSHLLQHGQVDLASNEARSALLTADLPGAAFPVLFSRLRSAQLFGKYGRITSSSNRNFWPFLRRDIQRGRCIPFLGPGVTRGLLPDRQAVAEKLAAEYEYPLTDCQNLPRVAQYMDINAPGSAREDYQGILRRNLFNFLEVPYTEKQEDAIRNATFTQTAEDLGWAEKVLGIQENEIHHLLADLSLPLYVTTNFDNFMYEALKHKGRAPRRVGPRWEQPGVGSPQFVLTPEPSREQPVVFHLNGHDGDPHQFRRLVLSEDDYLAHFVRLSSDKEQILPMNVLSRLSNHSFLFLGYELADWEFRIILQGLIKDIAKARSGIQVGVQLGIEQAPSVEKATEYLGSYLGHFDIDIYWGTAQDFVIELHSQLERVP